MENFILMVSENKSGVDWIRLADIVRGKSASLLQGEVVVKEHALSAVVNL
jgi:hypothetical protein